MRSALRWCLVISMVAVWGVVWADSIWDNAKGNLYTAERKRLRVGDVVTILISETSSAAQEATTKTTKQSGIGIDLLSGWDQVANLLGNETLRKTFSGRLSGNDTYQGTGQTARKSNVRAVVTAVITEILEGGNVYVVGEHKVKVNNEIETIRISGIIRPADITPANTVNSFQLAKAEVAVNGVGVVAAKQSPGVLTKLLGWFF